MVASRLFAVFLLLLADGVVRAEMEVSNATKKILIAGDSWGTDIAGGTVVGLSAFDRKLKEYDCEFDATKIAIAGSTAVQWATSTTLLDVLKLEAKSHDALWITLMGNDALATLPECAASGNTSEACGDLLVQKMTETMGRLLDVVHETNPSIRIVGFGYDVRICSTDPSLSYIRLSPHLSHLLFTYVFSYSTYIGHVWRIGVRNCHEGSFSTVLGKGKRRK